MKENKLQAFPFAAMAVAFFGISGVAVATAFTPGGGSPACLKRVDVPQDSQSDVQTGCTSWTECDESWQCASANPGPQVSCGTATVVTRYCRECINGTWNGDTQRCELGISGTCGSDIADGTRSMFLDPEYCP